MKRTAALTGAGVVAVVAIAFLLVQLAAPNRGLLSDHSRTEHPGSVGVAGTTAAFSGLGAWVDIYDFAPEYQTDGGTPVVTPATVATMAGAGVRTVFLQTAGTDPRTSGELVSPGLLTDFLRQAHDRGLRVIGWYQPTFADVNVDLAHLLAIARLDRDGQHFDGIAVDIEDVSDTPSAAERSQRLVELTDRLRTAVGASYPLAAITLPPLILDDINPQAWPGFPWHALASRYDVWIPMSYWTFRTPGSADANPRTYTEKNIELVRQLLGDPDAAVFALGGVAGQSGEQDYLAFLAGAAAAHAVGAAVYDYRSSSAAGIALLSAGVPPDGFAAPSGPLRGD